MTDDALAAEAAARTGELRRACAERLARLFRPASRQADGELVDELSGAFGLTVVPGDGRPYDLVIEAGPGFKPYDRLGFGPGIEGELATVEGVADLVVPGYPPRKRASAVVKRDGGPEAAFGLYESRELMLSAYVLWLGGDVRVFATAERAADALGVDDADRDRLIACLEGLRSGRDADFETGPVPSIRP